MRHWLKHVEWLKVLFERRKDAWFEWLSESTSSAVKADVLAGFEESPFEFLMPPLMLEMARDRVSRCVPLARGESYEMFDIEVSYQPLWWFDPEEPELLWLSLAESSPPYF